MRARRPTRNDVARLAGTSNAVVSYVINDGPRRVLPATRERVERAMKELGYQPNAIARSLSAKSTNTIGMIVPTLADAWVAELAVALEEAFGETDRILFLGNSGFEAERELAYVDDFIQHRVGAIVVLGAAHAASIARAREADVPMLAIYEPEDADRGRTVAFAQEHAAHAATTHLLQHGHRRIACLTGSIEPGFSDNHVRGWSAALIAADVEPDDRLILRQPYTLEGGAAALEQLLASPGGLPDAIYCASDELARGVLARTGASGLRVPDDLALISVGGTRAGDFSNPPITTFRWPLDQLAAAIARSVLGADDPADIGDGIVAELRVGRSCGCAITR